MWLPIPLPYSGTAKLILSQIPSTLKCRTTQFPPLLLGGFSSGRELVISHVCLKSRGLTSPDFCFLK